MRNEISVLAIPPDILDKLHRRVTLAAEVPTSEPEMRAFVVVIPKVTAPEPTTHNLSPVLGYEVCYVRHHARWEANYYYYDEAKADKLTRAKRVFVLRQPNEGALIAALREWGVAPSRLQRLHEFNSALVSYTSNYLFYKPDDFPHLWEE